MVGLFHARGAAAAICLCLSAGAVAQDREPVTAPVGYAGLDLASVAGQATLKRRIRQAASIACVPAVSGLAGDLDRNRCMTEMERDGAIRMATLIAVPTMQLAAVIKQPAK